jgi:hypothetical protein
MPEPTPVAPVPAVVTTEAVQPAAKVETLPQTPQPTATEKEKEARKAARIANAKRQFDRLNGERAKFQEEQNNWKQISAQALRDAGALQQLRKLAAEDPVKALEAMGHKFEDVLKRTANRGAVTPETIEATVNERVQAELAKFKSDMDEMARVKGIKDREQSETNAIANAKRMIAEEFAAHKDEYEFIDDSPSTLEDAWKLCVETYQATMDPKTNLGGIKLTWREALDKLEEKGFEYHLGVQEKSKKVKAALEAKAAKAKEEAAAAAAKAAPAKNTWPRRTEKAASSAPLTAASQAPNPAESVKSRPLSVTEKINRNLERYRAARASNDA